MTTLTKSLLALGVVAALAVPSTPSFAEEAVSKTERIEQLIEMTNASDVSVQVTETMFAQFRRALPQVPDEWWDSFIEKINASDINSLLIPVYERNFTDAEISAMVDFYQTPEGQSIIAKMPLLVEDSMAVGQTWGEGLALEVLHELEADGYEFPAQ
ncbi:MAG: DUF2059 domain-containing protein [Cyanobacteria bacterium J06627_32]